MQITAARLFRKGHELGLWWARTTLLNNLKGEGEATKLPVLREAANLRDAKITLAAKQDFNRDAPSGKKHKREQHDRHRVRAPTAIKSPFRPSPGGPLPSSPAA